MGFSISWQYFRGITEVTQSTINLHDVMKCLRIKPNMISKILDSTRWTFPAKLSGQNVVYINEHIFSNDLRNLWVLVANFRLLTNLCL